MKHFYHFYHFFTSPAGFKSMIPSSLQSNQPLWITPADWSSDCLNLIKTLLRQQAQVDENKPDNGSDGK